ncbi:MAG: hypothetical protein GF417_09900 [Candidatus Latescibacteria bacterium]|nr:hypothetical protein [bacterium]MBD3424739.1 hypothetical protein [Candidatus Latescibacterota bacterium]
MKKSEMKKLWRLLPFIILAVAVIAVTARSGLVAGKLQPFVSYQVAVVDYRLNLLEIRISYRCSSHDQVSFRCVGNGGLDPIEISAYSREGKELEISRSGRSWTVFNGKSDFELSYQVILTGEDRYSPLVRKKLSLLRTDRSRFLGMDLFLIPEKSTAEGVLVDYRTGKGEEIYSVYRNVGNRMILDECSQLGNLLCVSGDYEQRSAQIGSTEIIFMISRGWSFGSSEIFSLIKDIVVHEIGMFGSSPHDRYLFVCDRNPVQGDGGFDYYGVHQGPNVLLLFDPRMKRSNLYDLNMAVISHEFFHNWNGEALRPADESFMWFTEGVTVYYSYRVLKSLGIISPGRYRRKMEQIRESYLDNPYRKIVPIADSGNSDMSDKDMVNLMYDGGLLAADALDRHLNDVSRGSVSLLELLRNLYRKNSFGTRVDEGVLVREVRELTGRDISGFLTGLVRTPDPAEISGRESDPAGGV